MNRLATGLIAAIMAFQFGCGAIQTPSWDKPFGKGTWIPAAVCTLVGAGAGVGIQEARRGCNTLPETGFEDCDDGDYWQGALIGAAVGAVACGVAGHVFLDPTPEPPPPPPTPIPTATPEPPPPPEKITRRIVLRGINFDFDSSQIREVSRPVLDEAVRQLGDNPDVEVTVVGHTDARGSEDYNQSLSVRRAEAVFRYLINNGIKPERVQVVGMGETQPVATNDTEEGRAKNRRVELDVEQPNLEEDEGDDAEMDNLDDAAGAPADDGDGVEFGEP